MTFAYNLLVALGSVPNVMIVVIRKAKQRKKRSLHKVNAYFLAVFNAADGDKGTLGTKPTLILLCRWYYYLAIEVLYSI